MFFKAYGFRIAKACLAALCIVGGVFSFGQPVYFDRLHFGALLLGLLMAHKDVNVVGVIVILFAFRFLDEAFWQLDAGHWAVKLFFYGYAIFTAYFTRYDRLFKFYALIIGLSLLSEIYWYMTSYDAPQITWTMMLMAQCLLIRNFLIFRAPYTEQLVNIEALPKILDWRVSGTYLISFYIYFFILLEFLVRHVLNIHSLYIYNISPYLLQTLSVLLYYIVLLECTKVYLSKVIEI